MTRYFTHYWTNQTWEHGRTSGYDRVEHTAGNMFRKRGVGSEDYIYIITVVEGRLLLGGRMEVEQIMNRDEAVGLRGPDLWDAADHAIGKAESDSGMNFDRIVPDEVVRELRFMAGGKVVEPVFKGIDRLDTQTMRAVRELTPASSELLERLMVGGRANTHLANRGSDRASPKPDGRFVGNDEIRVDPSVPDPDAGNGRNKVRSYQGRVIDHAEQDAANRVLGAGGEEFVVDYERRLLTNRGRGDLTAKVCRVSETEGDGIGYDVLSFDECGNEKYIEVKTTNRGKGSPFYLSLNEIEFSEDYPDRYFLYRVFDFASSPKLFVLTGSLRLVCDLEPVQFRARYLP